MISATSPKHTFGRHFGPLPADPAALAGIATTTAAGFRTCTASTWALAQLLGIEPDGLQRLDDLGAGQHALEPEKPLLEPAGGLAAS